jgi:hypothetical protein
LDHEILERSRLGRQRKKFESGDKHVSIAVAVSDARHAKHFDVRLALYVNRQHSNLSYRKWLVGFKPAASSAQLGDADSVTLRQRAPPRQIWPIIRGFHEVTSPPGEASM